MNPLSSRRGQWSLVALLVALIVVLEVGAAYFLPGLARGTGRVATTAVVLVALALAAAIVWRLFAHSAQRLERRNRELQALQQANLDIYGELSLETVLQRVVDQAANLLSARYGAMSVVDEEGEVAQFLTTGIGKELQERIGAAPTGKGLLGVSLHQGERLRLDDLARDPRAAGVPDHHPHMKTLLAVPVATERRFRANLYVSERTDGRPFSAEDERTLERFADQAALAIEKAFLHRQLKILAVAEERARIAREMHDGLAQVLAYVNTKAQAVREYVLAGRREDAIRQLEQLATAAREVLVEVREGILALRTPSTGERSFRQVVEEYLAKWREQSGVQVAVEIPEQLKLDAAAELQLLRIIQEALSNVRKHSGAQRASLTIESSASGVRAVIDDPGVGFDQTSLEHKGSPRFGLAIMRERAESVGGRLVIDSTPGRGTSVQVDLPAA